MLPSCVVTSAQDLLEHEEIPLQLPARPRGGAVPALSGRLGKTDAVRGRQFLLQRRVLLHRQQIAVRHRPHRRRVAVRDPAVHLRE